MERRQLVGWALAAALGYGLYTSSQQKPDCPDGKCPAPAPARPAPQPAPPPDPKPRPGP